MSGWKLTISSLRPLVCLIFNKQTIFQEFLDKQTKILFLFPVRSPVYHTFFGINILCSAEISAFCQQSSTSQHLLMWQQPWGPAASRRMVDGGASSCYLSFLRKDHEPHHLGISTAVLLPLLLGPELLHHGLPGLATSATQGACSHHSWPLLNLWMIGSWPQDKLTPYGRSCGCLPWTSRPCWTPNSSDGSVAEKIGRSCMYIRQ